MNENEDSTTVENAETTDETAAMNTTVAVEGSADPDTFDREYVATLREECKRHRLRADDRDELAHRLHTMIIARTGRLADPDDLAYDEEHLTNPEALNAAIDQLLDKKPHLASRIPAGDVGQGRTTEATVNLADIMKGMV